MTSDRHPFTVTVTGCAYDQALQVMAERIGPDEDYGFDYTIDWSVGDLPKTVRSHVVPTEYDVEQRDGQVVLSDDRGRKFNAYTFDKAFAEAEAHQDPADPIHHEPFPSPADAPAPATQRLEYLRGEIRAERISYGEIAELQGLAPHIDEGDVELLQWAGVPEPGSELTREEMDEQATALAEQISALRVAHGKVLLEIVRHDIHAVAPTATKVTFVAGEWDNGYFLADDPAVRFPDDTTRLYMELDGEDEETAPEDLDRGLLADLTDAFGPFGSNGELTIDLVTLEVEA